ncbi:MAG: hypothetical protein QM315_10945 [Bacillota bacterium]|nr:hypothetical protein [Bacillota bacterium]
MNFKRDISEEKYVSCEAGTKKWSDIIRRFSKYTEEIHFSNAKVTDRIEYYNFPVLPTLETGEGWADIKTYLKVIRQTDPNVRIMFEHRSDLISDEELETCYSWVNGLLNGK